MNVRIIQHSKRFYPSLSSIVPANCLAELSEYDSAFHQIHKSLPRWSLTRTTLRLHIFKFLFPIVFVSFFSLLWAKTGIALSGGAAKGISHVGVLKILNENGIYPEIITGTSMGAVIGGLYASGVNPQEMEKFLITTDWNAIFNDQPNRRELSFDRKQTHDRHILSLPVENFRVKLPSGLITGHRLTGVLSTLIHKHIPQGLAENTLLPFCAVATDLANGEPVFLKEGDLAQILRASMSIPSVFVPARIGTKLLADGMLSQNLPASIAREIGADFLICVDVGTSLNDTSELESLDKIMDQAISFRNAKENEKQQKLCDVLILPQTTGISPSAFEKTKEWILRGEEAALKSMSLLTSAKIQTSTPPSFHTSSQPVYQISSISVEGLKAVSMHICMKEIDIQPGLVSLAKIQEAVNRLHRTTFFESVFFRIEDKNKLIFTLREQKPGMIGFGLRYDSQDRTAILLSSRLQHLYGPGTRAEFDLKLGQENILEHRAFFLHPLKFSSIAGYNFTGSWKENITKNFKMNTGEELKYYTWKAEVKAGTANAHNEAAAIGLSASYTHLNRSNITNSPDPSVFINEVFTFWKVDGLDQTWFPSRGSFAEAKISLADRRINEKVDFTERKLSWIRYEKISPKTSLMGGFKYASLEGDEIPAHRYYQLGGYGPFWITESLAGFDKDTVGGEHLLAGMIGLRYQHADIVTILKFNVGNSTNSWITTREYSSMLKAGGVTFGTHTHAGPVSLSIFRNNDEGFSTYINMGYLF